ncbi:MAG: hypothetical protein ABJN35_13395 [Erythrobacter sp.]
MPKPIRKHVKGLRRTSPSIAPKFDIGLPISRIDTRPMALLSIVLLAALMPLFRGPTHATILSLWDGVTEHALIEAPYDIADHDHRLPLNRLELTIDEQLLWNGELITGGQFSHLMSEVHNMNPQPIVEFEPEAQASYDSAAKVINILNWSGASYRIAGMEKYCRFGLDSFGDSGPSNSIAFTLNIHYIGLEDLHHYTRPPVTEPCEKRFAVQIVR